LWWCLHIHQLLKAHTTYLVLLPLLPSDMAENACVAGGDPFVVLLLPTLLL